MRFSNKILKLIPSRQDENYFIANDAVIFPGNGDLLRGKEAFKK